MTSEENDPDILQSLDMLDDEWVNRWITKFGTTRYDIRDFSFIVQSEKDIEDSRFSTDSSSTKK